MRKQILSFMFLVLGLILIIAGLTAKKPENVYSEKVFAERALQFNKAFSEFYDQLRTDIREIEEIFRDTLKVRDTLHTKDYFLNKLGATEEMSSLAFFQGLYRVAIKRDGTSLVYAIDSTESLDVVRWRRFESLKQISSWNESFEDPIEQTDWYNRLMESENEITWFLRDSKTGSNQRPAVSNVYCGFSYIADQKKTILIFQFAKDKLLEKFRPNSRNMASIVTLETTDGRTIELLDNELQDLQKDSLATALKLHFNKFQKEDQGTFNFTLKEEAYWSSFVRFPPETGLNYYLYTINNENLSSDSALTYSKIGIWGGIAMLLLGTFLLGVKKRYFYKSNRMAIPELSELLEDDENRYLEFKSSLRWDERQGKVNPDLEKVILKTLAAFGNTDGGILLIGVDDNKNIVGLENDLQSLKKQDTDYYEIHLLNILHRAMGVKYVSKYIRTQFETLSDGKVVCKIRDIAGDEPVFLKFKDKNGSMDEKFFVRSGNSSHEIESIPEINDYINKKYKK